MLSRVAAPSMRPAALSSTQWPGVPLSLQLSSGSHRLYSSYDRPPARSNPLVGNYTPVARPESTATADAPQPSRATQPAAPPKLEPHLDVSPESESLADSSLDSETPPPPPPQTPSGSQTFAQALNLEPPAKNSRDEKRAETFNIYEIIASKTSDSLDGERLQDPLKEPKVHARAVTGRTVFVKTKGGPQTATTPTIAIKVLQKLCRDQKVKQKAREQKFHERPGIKKKRLRMSRWRARFKTGFKATIGRVLELKRQGW
ncbi:hypothetical protein HIM_06151 [Hirsutella minnesotensis 3608]|uniref:Ribosomal protein S21 n=1 Tax=Hirsutella minnesotensis 3608 TaxID=1043627 RepID=A0A0F7ZNY4_9HYPO|nr:hypothetical protein HIM_06151 [Hirsutella minnesotensis 3608]